MTDYDEAIEAAKDAALKLVAETREIDVAACVEAAIAAYRGVTGEVPVCHKCGKFHLGEC